MVGSLTHGWRLSESSLIVQVNTGVEPREPVGEYDGSHMAAPLTPKRVVDTCFFVVSSLLIVLAMSPAFGQSHDKAPSPGSASIGKSDPAPSSFEVASIRVSPPDHGYTSISEFPSNRFTAKNKSLPFLIALAFGMDSRYVSGGPGWLDSDSQRYDITAKVDGEVELTEKQMQPLLQHLLEQRFNLTTHFENSVRPGYYLVIAKGGSKLLPNKGAPYVGYIMANRLRLQNASIKTFASMLASPIDRPVFDKTGIEGLYDFNLKFAPNGVADSTLPDLFTALQEQLGLKLESAKIPIQTLVIDHIDKLPTEN